MQRDVISEHVKCKSHYIVHCHQQGDAAKIQAIALLHGLHSSVRKREALDSALQLERPPIRMYEVVCDVPHYSTLVVAL